VKKLFLLFCLLLAMPAHAEEPAKPAAVVAELFTSQGCSSCPPAQAFVAELAKRDDVLALELHVDYWDDLKTMFHGTWKDPYSDSVWSQRQLEYNRRLMGEDRVYTPQIVIDGRFQEAGTNKSAVKDFIEQARSQRRARYDLTTATAADGVDVTVDGAGKGIMKPLQVVLARLVTEGTTKITAGENSGTTQLSRNIVKDMMVVGTWSGGRETYKAPIPAFKEKEGCAVLLQDPENMHILAGARCNL
jgi:hypothetical protein